MEERRHSKRRKSSGRRAADDSSLSVPESDRRTAPRPESPVRRRQGDRRLPVDRRLAPDTFDDVTSSNVEDIMLKAGILVACPRCNEQLTLGPVIYRGMGSQREVRCAKCRKSVVIHNLP